MTLGISDPRQAYKSGMNENPSTYGSTKISSGAASVTVTCGYLTKDSVVKIFQNASSASQKGQIIEAKYDGSGVYQRTNGMAGTFKVSTIDGANAGADINFDWMVLGSRAL